jgi:hypothetical protein
MTYMTGDGVWGYDMSLSLCSLTLQIEVWMTWLDGFRSAGYGPESGFPISGKQARFKSREDLSTYAMTPPRAKESLSQLKDLSRIHPGIGAI